MIEAAIRALLLSDSTIYECVKTRIFPLELPLDCQLPALSYSKISNPYKKVVGFPRVQISCWAEDYQQCLNLYEAVTGKLEGFSGIVNGVNIERIIPIDAPDDYSSSTGVYHIPADFKVIFRK
jgi:hypothetical protein